MKQPRRRGWEGVDWFDGSMESSGRHEGTQATRGEKTEGIRGVPSMPSFLSFLIRLERDLQLISRASLPLTSRDLDACVLA